MNSFSTYFDKLYNHNEPFLFIISYDGTQKFIKPLSEIDSELIKYSFPGISNFSRRTENKSEITMTMKNTLSYEQYLKQFQKVHKHLYDGDSYLLNLTASTEVDLNCSLSKIFENVSAMYKICYNDDFIFFSPERFIKIENGFIYTNPMKGTIEANDSNSLTELMNNSKEEAEHITVVDLLRNDLSIVSSEVNVLKYRYPQLLHTSKGKIWQTSSEIQGKLQRDYLKNPSKIFKKILPAGSVTGAPKVKTVEIINSTETHNRNWYTGVAGIFNGETIDSCVIIRYIEKKNSSYYYKSGGGITVYSQPEDEYKELISKIYVPLN